MSTRLILGHKTWWQLIRIRFWCNYKANTDAQEQITCCEALCLLLCSSSPRSHSLFCCTLSNFPLLSWHKCVPVNMLRIIHTKMRMLRLFRSPQNPRMTHPRVMLDVRSKRFNPMQLRTFLVLQLDLANLPVFSC